MVEAEWGKREVGGRRKEGFFQEEHPGAVLVLQQVGREKGRDERAGRDRRRGEGREKQINEVLLCPARAAACERRVKVVPVTRPDLPDSVRLSRLSWLCVLREGAHPSGEGRVAAEVVLVSLRDVVLTRGCGWSFKAVVAI